MPARTHSWIRERQMAQGILDAIMERTRYLAVLDENDDGRYFIKLFAPYDLGQSASMYPPYLVIRTERQADEFFDFARECTPHWLR